MVAQPQFNGTVLRFDAASSTWAALGPEVVIPSFPTSVSSRPTVTVAFDSKDVRGHIEGSACGWLLCEGAGRVWRPAVRLSSGASPAQTLERCISHYHRAQPAGPQPAGPQPAGSTCMWPRYWARRPSHSRPPLLLSSLRRCCLPPFPHTRAGAVCRIPGQQQDGSCVPLVRAECTARRTGLPCRAAPLASPGSLVEPCRGTAPHVLPHAVQRCACCLGLQHALHPLQLLLLRGQRLMPTC